MAPCLRFVINNWLADMARWSRSRPGSSCYGKYWQVQPCFAVLTIVRHIKVLCVLFVVRVPTWPVQTKYLSFKHDCKDWYCRPCICGIFPFNCIVDDIEFNSCLFSYMHSNNINADIIRNTSNCSCVVSDHYVLKTLILTNIYSIRPKLVVTDIT